MLDVFVAFLKLGLTSFGGPVAHLGWFRAEFVVRRRWLDDAAFGELLALCQFLPGPASSQLGLAIGLQRAGWGGALAAWLGFTLPSALLMMAFGMGVMAGGDALTDGGRWAGALHGLKVIAVAVVAQAVGAMGRTLCPDRERLGVAFAAAILTMALPAAGGQLAAIAAGALFGVAGLRHATAAGAAAPLTIPLSRRCGAALLLLWLALLLGLPLLAWAWAPAPLLAAFAGFYRAGALVFGGGHVVLPLLHGVVVDPAVGVGAQTFLAGYGAAQALPGPLFTFGAFLGTVMPAPLGGFGGGALMLLAIFLPGALLVLGALPFWQGLSARPGWRAALAGVNAAVVGVLLAALIDPVWSGAIRGPADALMALAAWGLLARGRVSPLIVVAAGAALGAAMASAAIRG